MSSLNQIEPIHIIGGGIAGSEAAWQIAEAGVPVILYEMRPGNKTFAHQTEYLAELVCSNSFRSNDDENNAVGQLHWEMKKANGLIIKTAERNRVIAGSALAVDRNKFSSEISYKLKNHPLIKIKNEEVTTLPKMQFKNVIIATGPLTSEALSKDIVRETSEENLAFFDAISPIIYADSINYDKAWFQSRYDKGETEKDRKAYLNCALNKEQYEKFVNALRDSSKTQFKSWEKETPYFNGCLPIEVMAERGLDTLRFGPLKPVGLTNPFMSSEKPYAIVQLRHENSSGSLFNMVGFQTKMKHSEQIKVLTSIPGLENARFARLGGIHRNTFLNSPKLLDSELKLISSKNIRFAGQITGVEGYVESAAIGLLAGRMAAAEALNSRLPLIPRETAMGGLYNHITQKRNKAMFQPMNVNFGLFPNLESTSKGRKNRKNRYKAYTDRAKIAWEKWLLNITSEIHKYQNNK